MASAEELELGWRVSTTNTYEPVGDNLFKLDHLIEVLNVVREWVGKDVPVRVGVGRNATRNQCQLVCVEATKWSGGACVFLGNRREE
jgi:hypothetical protein